MTAINFEIIKGRSVLEKSVALDENKKFLSDILATFRYEKHGIVGSWQYSSNLHAHDPVRGAFLWEMFLKTSTDYYPLQNEIRLIQERAHDLIEDKEAPVILVDIGPGPEHAVQNKTLPVAKHFKSIDMYCPIDMCSDYLVTANRIMSRNFPMTPTKAYHVDYFHDKIVLPKREKAFGIYFGGTIGNFEGHPNDGLPEQAVISQLVHIKKILGKGGILMMTHDANQDEQSILRSYSHRIQKEFGRNIMYRIKRDLPVYGDYEPQGWHYEPVWYAQSHQLAHTIICDCGQTFWVGNERFAIKAGERFILNNSFKYPVRKMQEWAALAGFEKQKYVMDHQGRQALHLLEV